MARPAETVAAMRTAVGRCSPEPTGSGTGGGGSGVGLKSVERSSSPLEGAMVEMDGDEEGGWGADALDE